ncbi:MAG: M23 family metallopeptidase [Flavobacteriaceae bacterium]|nr:M23 family metallopeptidase [Flavobacteriaceae bacterium]
MKKETSRSKRIKKKLLSRYRLVILNEQTFEEQLYFRLTRLNVIIICTFLFALLFTGTIALVSYTPIKEIIPGYASTKMRKQAAENAFRLDSLLDAYRQSNQQLSAIRKVLIGEVDIAEIKEYAINLDTQNIVNLSNLKRSKQDSLLRSLVEQEDKYSVALTSGSKVDFVLYPPAIGNLSQAYDPVDKHYAVDIVLNENAPVKAVAEGTVIFSEWTADTGYVIIIEHPYGLLSVYKHNASLSKFQGETVAAGEVIATAGNTGKYSTGYHLHFELWSDGFPMNPENFIDFSQN